MQTFDVIADNGAAMRLEFDRDASRLNLGIAAPGTDMRHITFNNIGEADPLEFLADRDWSYMRDKVFRTAGRKPSFLSSVVSIREIANNHEENDLTLDKAAILLDDLNDAMVGYAGEDELSCHSLISALKKAGFHDDTHHMICNAEPKDVRDFRAHIWEPLRQKAQEISERSYESPFDLDVEEDDETPEFC